MLLSEVHFAHYPNEYVPDGSFISVEMKRQIGCVCTGLSATD